MTKKPVKPAAAAKPTPAKSKPAVGDAPHPLVDYALGLLSKAKGGQYQLGPPAAMKLRHAVLDLQGRPDFTLAVKDLAMLAHLLETKHQSKVAAQALLETTEAALAISQGKPVSKRS